MSDLTITCNRCQAAIDHRCNTNLMRVIVELYTWAPSFGMPDFLVREAKKEGYYSEEDDDDSAPVISEAFLYPLLGKDDARTLLGLVGAVVAAAGLDEMAVHRDVCAREDELAVERTKKAEVESKLYLVRQIKLSGKKGFGITEDQWPLVGHLEKLDRVQIGKPYMRSGKQWRKYWFIDNDDD